MDVDIQGAGVIGELGVPHFLHKVSPGEHPSSMAHKGFQQCGQLGGKVVLLPPFYQHSPEQVKGEVSGFEEPFVLREPLKLVGELAPSQRVSDYGIGFKTFAFALVLEDYEREHIDVVLEEAINLLPRLAVEGNHIQQHALRKFTEFPAYLLRVRRDEDGLIACPRHR